MTDEPSAPMDRRSLFRMIGAVAGSAVMYEAMSQLGFAGESGYSGPIELTGDVQGASVLILGAGVAGMAAAYELRKAGYRVQILEYNDRPGGRNWSLYGGDTYTELGGFTQQVRFAPGLYLNPGPWRLPHHHLAVIDYCKRLKVTLEPFTQVNYAAFVQSPDAFGGKAETLSGGAGGFQRSRGRTSVQVRKSARARSGGHQGRSGSAARSDARVGSAR
jgi:monoamine oxidase